MNSRLPSGSPAGGASSQMSPRCRQRAISVLGQLPQRCQGLAAMGRAVEQVVEDVADHPWPSIT